MEVLTLRLAHSKHSLKGSCCYNFIIAIIIVFAIIICSSNKLDSFCSLNLVWNLCRIPWDSNDRSPTHGERVEHSGGNRKRKRFYMGMGSQRLGHAIWLNTPNARLKMCVSYSYRLFHPTPHTHPSKFIC